MKRFVLVVGVAFGLSGAVACTSLNQSTDAGRNGDGPAANGAGGNAGTAGHVGAAGAGGGNAPDGGAGGIAGTGGIVGAGGNAGTAGHVGGAGAGGGPDGGAGGIVGAGGVTGTGGMPAVQQYALTVAMGGTGTGTVTGSGIACGTVCVELVDLGATVTLTATPSAASGFVGWSGGGCAGTGPCSVIITAATTVTATFNVENCRNGIDDDGNGFIDCADPACAAQLYHCATVPAGWMGPVARGHDVTSTTACAGDYAASAYGGYTNLDSGSASCSACSCGPSTCGISGLFGSGCGAGEKKLTLSTTTSGACITPAFMTVYEDFRGATAISQDACAPPVGGILSATAASFLASGQLCTLTATALGGCGASAICAPPATGQLDQKLCIYRVGTFACPAGSFSASTTYDSSLVDTRACTSCSCTLAAGGCGTLTGTWYSGADCSGNVVSTLSVGPTNPGCAVSTDGRTSVRFDGAPAACSPSGGAVTGSVTASNPVTVCCEP